MIVSSFAAIPLSDVCVTQEQIESKLKSLKIDKSPGPDLLHPRILYETRKEIAEPLKKIFDASLRAGQLPVEWKTAVITVIHKKGEKSDVANYRPVSLTCVICKIMESFIRDHIMQHMTQVKLTGL